MKEYLAPAIRLTITSLVFFSGIYTLLVFAAAQFSGNNGKGEIIMQEGKKYYANVGQKFTQDKYFYSRPSAVDYNAAGAGGSNKGPSNPDYLETIKQRIDSFLVHNPGINRNNIPADLVTASGSGLDPDISVQAANIQVKRIAVIRGIAAANLEQLVITNTERPLAGLGPEHINVLKLNLALDNLK